MLNALLIQLFGREVVEKLAEAGFESCARIADAGVDRLAEKSGITETLARRIIAVAMEEPQEADEAPEGDVALEIPVAAEAAFAPEATSRPEAGPATKAARKRSGSSGDEPRPQAARKSGPGAGAAAKAKPVPRPKIEIATEDADPFVDDVGLVRWMGLAGMDGGYREMSITVADEILDSGSLAIDEDAPQSAPSRAGADAAHAAEPIADSSRAMAAALFSAIAASPGALPEVGSAPEIGAAPVPSKVRESVAASGFIVAPGSAVASGSTVTPEPVVAPGPPARPAAPSPPIDRGMRRPVKPGAAASLVAGSFWSFGGPQPPKPPASRPPSPPASPRRRSQDGH